LNKLLLVSNSWDLVAAENVALQTRPPQIITVIRPAAHSDPCKQFFGLVEYRKNWFSSVSSICSTRFGLEHLEGVRAIGTCLAMNLGLQIHESLNG
jgi:hypothetical protein